MRRDWLICVILAALTVIVFWQTTSYPFINLDDHNYVSMNSHIKQGINPRTIGWAFSNRVDANWMPLVWISYMGDHLMGGVTGRFKEGQPVENAAPYHRTNVILHALNTLLLFGLLTSLTGRRWRSAFVAALFAIHPLHVESVAWVAERKDVLSTFFMMLTLSAYAWYVRRPGIGRYLAVAAAFGLGLMTKSMLVTLPILMLFMDMWPLGRLRGWTGGRKKPGTGLWRLALEKAPLLVMSLAVGIVTLVYQQHGGAIKSLDRFPLGIRISNAVVSYVLYIWKMLYPDRLCIHYRHPGASLDACLVAVSWLLITALTAAAIIVRRRAPYATVGWMWFLVSLLPVIGVIQIGDQGMADRYGYVTLIGLFIVIAWGVPELLAKAGRWKNMALAVSAVTCVAVLTTVACTQVRYWRSDDAVFGHVLAISGFDPPVERALADAMMKNSDFTGAIRHYRAVLSYNPDDAGCHFHLAQAFHRLGRVDDAVEDYQAAYRIGFQRWAAANNLAWILATSPRLRNPSKAMRWAETANRLTHFRDPSAIDTMAVAYASAGRYQEAIAAAEKAARLASEGRRPDMALDIRSRIPLYQAHKAYLDTD